MEEHNFEAQLYIYLNLNYTLGHEWSPNVGKMMHIPSLRGV
jgi:hypothetical protein